MKTISIVAPAYNEAANLPALAEAVGALLEKKLLPMGYAGRLLIVNDGSSDDTPQILQQLHSRYPFLDYINLSRNFGKENALLAGIDHADGDAVVIIDSDLQHPLDVIPDMIKCWEDGYDDVYGERLDRGKESWMRRKLSLSYYNLLQRSTPMEILPNVGDFRLLDRRCIRILRELRETQRYNKGLFAWIGFKKKGVPYQTADRTAGKSSFNLRRLIRLSIEGISSTTTAPLRFATWLGIIVSFIAFCYLLIVLCKTIIWGEPVRGYPTILCVILFLGGCQLLALGIIGEYIARIFSESKHRPPYIARDIVKHPSP